MPAERTCASCGALFLEPAAAPGSTPDSDRDESFRLWKRQLRYGMREWQSSYGSHRRFPEVPMTSLWYSRYKKTSDGGPDAVQVLS